MLTSYEDALERIVASTQAVDRSAEAVSLPEPWPWRVLAEPLKATAGHPRFDNSAVDGYAFHADDLARFGVRFRIEVTVASGAGGPLTLRPGVAARIFTGAPVPIGTAAIAMQEDVDVANGSVTLRMPLTAGDGVRLAGTDFAAGQILLNSGTPISPGVAGLLASQGVTRPCVMALPRCAVITTGDEIVSPGQEPRPGELRDSIGTMLAHAAAPYAQASHSYAPDDPSRLGRQLSSALEQCDAVFVAGGASVGDRDFTGAVVADMGRVLFHGINVRPGKPLLFGIVSGKPVIGLPGNPASSFVCFHLFGIPVLKRMAGWAEPHHLWLEARYGADHEPESRDFFARVTLDGGVAMPVLEQASFGLRSLGAAHALARLQANVAVRKGETVQITML